MARRTIPSNRAVVYCRVSTDLQERDGTSLETQEAACLTHATRQGWQVERVVRETQSGYTLERPGLEMLRQMARDGQAGIVLAYALDRLSRNQNHLGILLDEAKRVGVRLEFVTERFEDTAMGRMVMGLRAGFAEMEREIIRERTLRGKRARALSGRVPGMGVELYGYRRTAEGTRQIVEIEAATIRQVYRWVDDGESIRAIVRRLRLSGIPSPAARRTAGPQQWQTSSVQRLVRNPNYCGRGTAWRWQRDGLTGTNRIRPEAEQIALPDGVVPAIVPPALWDRVQERLTANHGEATRNERRPYLLRGHIWCALCGERLYSDVRRGKRLYRCSSRDKAGRCGAGQVPAIECETAVWDGLQDVLAHPERISAEIERYGAEMAAEVLPDLEAARRRLAEAARRHEAMVSRVTEMDSYTWEVAQRELTRLAREVQQSRQAVVDLEQRQAVAEAGMNPVARLRQFCEMIAQTIGALDFEGQRRALAAVSARVRANGRAWWLAIEVPMFAGDGKPSAVSRNGAQNAATVRVEIALSGRGAR